MNNQLARIAHAPCGFMTLDIDGIILSVNETMLKWLGKKHEQLIGYHFEILLSKVNKLIFHSYFYPTISIQERVEELILKLLHEDGESHPYILNARKFEEESIIYVDCAFIRIDQRANYESELKYAQSSVQEALKQKEAAYEALEKLHFEIEEKQEELIMMNENLEKLSNVDQLTGIYNRRYLQEHLSLLERSKTDFSMIVVDIDHFKSVNDTYGHLVGDDVLSRLAQLMQQFSGERAVVTRYGGEEFVLVLPLATAEEGIYFAKELNKLIAAENFAEVGHITISLGVSTTCENCSVHQMFKKADDALYYAKKHGRNQAIHYNQLEI